MHPDALQFAEIYVVEPGYIGGILLDIEKARSVPCSRPQGKVARVVQMTMPAADGLSYIARMAGNDMSRDQMQRRLDQMHSKD